MGTISRHIKFELFSELLDTLVLFWSAAHSTKMSEHNCKHVLNFIKVVWIWGKTKHNRRARLQISILFSTRLSDLGPRVRLDVKICIAAQPCGLYLTQCHLSSATVSEIMSRIRFSTVYVTPQYYVFFLSLKFMLYVLSIYICINQIQ